MEWVLKRFGKNIYYKGTINIMLDSIRSSLLGRAHYPHQHFMATGAHSITLVTHGKNEKDNSGRIRDFIWILEKLVRIHDQLDE